MIGHDKCWCNYTLMQPQVTFINDFLLVSTITAIAITHLIKPPANLS